jgi:hypothetical protein
MDPLRFWPQNHNASEDEKTECFHIAATMAADEKIKVVVNGTEHIHLTKTRRVTDHAKLQWRYYID